MAVTGDIVAVDSTFVDAVAMEEVLVVLAVL